MNYDYHVDTDYHVNIDEGMSNMVGKTFVKVDKVNRCDLVFETGDGEVFVFTHFQDGYENVYIEDIAGSLDDLVGTPLLQAEEVEGETLEPVDYSSSVTWTFYKFATIYGSVTVRWYGTSNGYYSERVDMAHIPPNSEPRF